MKEKDIRDAWARIRTIANTIPDEVLDFMKDAAIEKLNANLKKDSVAVIISKQYDFLENESSWSC